MAGANNPTHQAFRPMVTSHGAGQSGWRTTGCGHWFKGVKSTFLVAQT